MLVIPGFRQIKNKEIPQAVPVLIGSMSKQALSHFLLPFLGLTRTSLRLYLQ